MPYPDEGEPYEEALLEARPILWHAAKSRGKLSCNEFADQIHAIQIPGRGSRFRNFLDEICRVEYGLAPGSLLLTAVVYSKHRNLPGAGFFKLAAERDGRDEIPKGEWRAFWKRELGRLYDHAGKHPDLP